MGFLHAVVIDCVQGQNKGGGNNGTPPVYGPPAPDNSWAILGNPSAFLEDNQGRQIPIYDMPKPNPLGTNYSNTEPSENTLEQVYRCSIPKWSLEDFLSRMSIYCTDKYGQRWTGIEEDMREFQTFRMGWAHYGDSQTPFSDIIRSNQGNCRVYWEIFHTFDPDVGRYGYNGIGCYIVF